MKVLLLLTLLALAMTISCHHEQQVQKKTLKCFARTEFVSAMKTVKTFGFQNMIKSKLTLPGIIQSFKSVLGCLAKNVTENVHVAQSIFAKIGMSALYFSNCGKDVGMVFLLLDNIVQQVNSAKPEWFSIVVEAIGEYIILQQGFGDCKTAFEYVVGLFRK